MNQTLKICPKCGHVMTINTDLVLTSNPPQYYYTCSNCGYKESDYNPPIGTGTVEEAHKINNDSSFKKVPFEINKAKELESKSPGQFIITNMHRKVRIISWDKKNGNNRTNIVALVETLEGDTETIQVYDDKGHLIADSSNRKNWDLYMLVEPNYIPGKPSDLSDIDSQIYDILHDIEPNDNDSILNAIKKLHIWFFISRLAFPNTFKVEPSELSEPCVPYLPDYGTKWEITCTNNFDCESCHKNDGKSSVCCPKYNCNDDCF